jgi:hypothetical protein
MKRWFLAAVAVAAVALAVAGGAYATMEGHEVSTVDPYALCPITPDIFGGVNYPNTEPEPWVARNPADDDNLIGSFQQDRWSSGGARGLTASWTFNDGANWDVTALPFSKCALPYYAGVPCEQPQGVASPTPCSLPYDRASDPWQDIGPDGTAYAVSISFDANDNDNAVGAAVSTDGGVTWHNQAFVQRDFDTDPNFPFNDKESVTADPVHAGFAYAVWDRLVLVPCGPASAAQAAHADDRPFPHTGGGVSAQQEICFEGPTFFSRTTDGGLTWETPRPIVPTGVDEQTIGNVIVVDPTNDRLYDFYVFFPNTPPFTPELRMVFSDDQGVTWSDQQFINTLQAVGIHDPQTGAPARTGDIIPIPTIDDRTGQLYLAWQDGRFNDNGEDDVVVSTSVGAGLTGTWTPPQKVNLPEDRAGFTPGIKVNALGQLGIDYYSLRHPDDGPDVWPINRYLRITSGPAVVDTSGPTATFDFNQPTHVAGPFNMLMAPEAGGFFVGDYESMAIDADGRRFHTFFAQPNCDTTNCPAVGVPAPETGETVAPGPKQDPFDVYTNKYFKNG